MGLNAAALGLLGAVLAALAEPGGLPARWTGWAWAAGGAALVGLAGFRFPRAVGLPLLGLLAVAGWLTVGALKEFSPVGPALVLPTAQPLNDRELVTAFAVRVDTIAPPGAVPGVPRQLCRWRLGNAAPAEWWWPWVQSQGWGRSSGAAMPGHPVKFGVYRLVLTAGRPVWRLEKPELAPP